MAQPLIVIAEEDVIIGILSMHGWTYDATMEVA
jgi:hypothetical protein